MRKTPRREAAHVHEFARELPGDAELATALMTRQARLAIGVAATFMLLMLGLPVANVLWPDAMQTRVLGFPLSWLLLGIALYPVTWALAAHYVRSAEQLEADDARLVQERRRG